MKSVLVIVILVGVYLFYPTYDLLVKDSPFDETFTLQDSQFLTADRCREAAMVMKLRYFHCAGSSNWSDLLSTYGSYQPEKRYSDPGLFKKDTN
ncbi:MAG: hypothetical protein ABJM39_05365 [Porticoccus sp.]|mgnify:CR=1 FL=1|jgi:hypothetical protein|uniref:hypothetical protein n=1 Tax=Porticoccus sp. TaxID=2024853 RepID=UPI003297BF64|tara:strand:- start:52 stop:333 length:282 start_codon:yes stop_codon:yes gene_type:complete